MPSYIPGIDVSRWQGTINWQSVSTAGKKFVFIKATEGSTWVDPFFAANWKGAKEAGLLRGAYHFFHPLQDARKQAELFLKTVKLEPGDFAPVLDLEITENLRTATIIQRVEIFITEIEKQVGLKTILYSGVAFLNESFTIPAGGPPLWAKDHLLWIANYLPATATQPYLPRGWQKWTFWQHSISGKVNGISGNVDLNWFNGSLEELQTLAGIINAPAGNVIYTVKAGDSWSTIAAQHNLSIERLAQANPQLLPVGVMLNIPPSGEDTLPDDPAPGERTYTVQPGDNLSKIAARFNTTVEAIVLANNIINPNLISVGQVLTIPDPTPSSDFTPI